MDPYLESTLFWRKVHGHLLSDMTYRLNEAIVPLGFVAQYEERCYVLPLPGFVYPDAVILRSPDVDQWSGVGSSGAVAVAEATPPLVLELHAEEVHEPYIEIRAAGDDERVVTVIELLSPANKTRDGIGRDAYRSKQRALLNSRSHLLEIDLLRDGSHTVAAPRAAIFAATGRHFDYVVSLHREGSRGERFEVWPFAVRAAMPTIRVPLSDGLPDVQIALQPLLDQVYDRSGVGKRVHYAEDPEPALAPADATWVDALLRERGLRA
jgi:hypothetical protein